MEIVNCYGHWDGQWADSNWGEEEMDGIQLCEKYLTVLKCVEKYKCN